MKLQHILEAKSANRQQLYEFIYTVPLEYYGEQKEGDVLFPINKGWVEGEKLFIVEAYTRWEPENVSAYDFDSEEEYNEWVSEAPWDGVIIAVGAEQAGERYLEKLRSEFTWDAEIEGQTDLTDEEAARMINET